MKYERLTDWKEFDLIPITLAGHDDSENYGYCFSVVEIPVVEIDVDTLVNPEYTEMLCQTVLWTFSQSFWEMLIERLGSTNIEGVRLFHHTLLHNFRLQLDLSDEVLNNNEELAMASFALSVLDPDDVRQDFLNYDRQTRAIILRRLDQILNLNYPDKGVFLN